MVSYTICEQEEIRMRTMKRKGAFLGLMMLAVAAFMTGLSSRRRLSKRETARKLK